MENKDKPGIGNSTFAIPLDEKWMCNQEIISPRDYKVTTSSGIMWMTKQEIINKYSDDLTDEQIELLKNN